MHSFNARVGEVGMLARAAALDTWNLPKRIQSVCGLIPNMIAVETEERGRSFQDLENDSSAFACFLEENGIRPGCKVLLLFDDVYLQITAILGILKAGCIFVPLDPNHPDGKLAGLLSAHRNDFLVASRDWDARISVLASRAGFLENHVLRAGNLFASTVVRSANHAWMPDDPCYVYYTSGSTGKPKGVVGRMKSLVHFLDWELGEFAVGQGTRVSQLTPIAFDPFLRDIFVPLLAGGTICVPPAARGDVITGLARWIGEKDIHLIHCIPSTLRYLLATDWPSTWSGLNIVLSAGEPLYGEDVRSWFSHFGSEKILANLYGPTETTLAKCFHRVTRNDIKNRLVPVGKCMPGASVAVFDVNGKVVGPDIAGELYIRTSFASLGYLGETGMGAKFFSDTEAGKSGDTVYKTGDLAKISPEGTIEILGRLDNQVKVDGVRIELEEVEGVCRGYRPILDVAASMQAKSLVGPILTAFIVAGNAYNEAEFWAFLRDNLSLQAMPKEIRKLDALPRSANGKLDRAALSGSFDYGVGGAGPEAPSDGLEELLGRSLLLAQGKSDGIPVHPHANLFGEGLHSLQALRYLHLLKTELGREIPLEWLFESPTIRGLAGRIRKVDSVPYNIATRLRSDPRPDGMP
jgi:amino acid adenylation domain-containing protein